MKICKVVFNIQDDFVEEMKNYAPLRLRNVFRRNENRPSSLAETFLGYDNLKPYTYKTVIEDLLPGDIVVVQSKDTYALATFVEYVPVVGDNYPKDVTMKFLINKVDFTAFYSARAKEDKKKELLVKMNERKKALEEVTIYRMLAETDPEMKAMLNELNDLNR